MVMMNNNSSLFLQYYYDISCHMHHGSMLHTLLGTPQIAKFRRELILNVCNLAYHQDLKFQILRIH